MTKPHIRELRPHNPLPWLRRFEVRLSDGTCVWIETTTIRALAFYIAHGMGGLFWPE